MKKKLSEYERFMALSDREKDAEVAKYDREMLIDDFKPLSRESRALLERAARKPGRPKVGQGARRVLLSIEGGLLKEADSTASKLHITRSELVARGLRAAIACAG
jgi:hypothetical protein